MHCGKACLCEAGALKSSPFVVYLQACLLVLNVTTAQEKKEEENTYYL